MYTFDFEDLEDEAKSRPGVQEKPPTDIVEQKRDAGPEDEAFPGSGEREKERLDPVEQNTNDGSFPAASEPADSADCGLVPAAGNFNRCPAGCFLVLQPVGDLCERVQAVISAGMLAKDLGRELELLWTPDMACNCSWERLFAPATWLQVLDPAMVGGQEGALDAAVELLRLWDMVCVASSHEDLLELALERFNRAHWSHFHAGLASFVDPAAAKMQQFHRFNAIDWDDLPDLLHATCVCIRASGDFYPCRPGTRYGQDELSVERSLLLHGLPLAPALAQSLQKLDPGTVCIDASSLETPGAVQAPPEEEDAAASSALASQLQPLEEVMDAFGNGLRDVSADVPFSGFHVAAGSTAAVKERWSKRYKQRVTFSRKRASNSSVPQAVEDTLISLATLARGTLLFTDRLSPRSDIVSLLGSTTIEVISSSSTCAADPDTSPDRNPKEALSRLLDPSMPDGPFFAVGSWDDWKAMKELRETTLGSGAQYETRITVKENTLVEFQVLRNGDWGQRFFPTEDGLIWGPCSRHGANWRLQVPEGCATLRLVWNPQGQRTLEWFFVFTSGAESLGDGSQMQSVPFFIAGSWDGWKDFVQLCPGSPGGGPPYRAKIQVQGFVEFQVFRGRGWRQRFYPSAWGGKICGPSSGHGQNWRVETPAGCKFLKVTWDPRGHKSLRWRFMTHNDRVIEHAKPNKPTPDLPRVMNSARPTLPTRIGSMEVPQRLGEWRLLSMLGKGYVGAVFRAKPWVAEEPDEFGDDSEEEEVAVKFPSLACEVDALRRVRNVEGVPRVMDVGYGPGKTLFCAMPILGPSLKALLRWCNHDGRGGRVSGQAARSLGVSLVKALRGIHRCGIVHCDVNPGNILFSLKDASPQLIDFGWARNIGEAHFEKTVGTCMYNSIRAGFGGQRTPADDLESVGWLLLQLVLGRLPWAERDEGVSAQQREAWQRRSEGISVAKELFLADTSIFGPEFDHCPSELAKYLRVCQAAGPDPAAHIDYSQLVSALREPDQSIDPTKHWSRLLEVNSGQLDKETLYKASRGLICYRPAGKPQEWGTEKVCSVTKDLLIRTTGDMASCTHGGRWVEVDPCWAPKLPPALQDFSWLLISKVTLPKIPWEDDTQKNGPLLVPAGAGGNAG